MTHKKVNNADAGTLTKFGGNDLDKWSDFANGVDTDDYDINADFTVRSGKRYLRNPANTFSYQEIASAIAANRTVTEPLLTGNDTRVYQGHTQPLTSKTIDFDLNTVPNSQTGCEYTVYTAGANTKCRDNITGTIVSTSSTAPETPIRYAITNGIDKKIYISSGTYNLSSGFSEFQFDVNQARELLEFSPGAKVSVPNGYTGNLFNIKEGSTMVKIVGGLFNEQGTQQRLWTGFNYESTSASGVNSCHLYGFPYIRNTAAAIKLNTTTTGPASDGWVNNCTFQDIFIDRSAIGIEFVQGAGSFGINRNYFRNVSIQASLTDTPHLDYGVKNIAGNANEFHKVHVYDITAGGIFSNITTTAAETLIIGGRMTSKNAATYTDNGVNTIVRDAWLKKWRKEGTLSDTGTGAKLTFSMAHGLLVLPTWWNAVAANSGARSQSFYVTADITFIYVVLSAAPANGVALVYNWEVSG